MLVLGSDDFDKISTCFCLFETCLELERCKGDRHYLATKLTF